MDNGPAAGRHLEMPRAANQPCGSMGIRAPFVVSQADDGKRATISEFREYHTVRMQEQGEKMVMGSVKGFGSLV